MNVREVREIMKARDNLIRQTNLEDIYSLIRRAALEGKNKLEIQGNDIPEIISRFDEISKEMLEKQGYKIDYRDTLYINFEKNTQDIDTKVIYGYIKIEW